jgi:hypothetical protein
MHDIARTFLPSTPMPTTMATTVDPFLKGSMGRNTRGLLRITILCVIAAAAVASRLFSVIRKCILISANASHYPFVRH